MLTLSNLQKVYFYNNRIFVAENSLFCCPKQTVLLAKHNEILPLTYVVRIKTHVQVLYTRLL